MADRTIRILLQAGIILAVIAALPYKMFELDRYFVPKELVLNVAALLIAVVLLFRLRSLSFDVVDGLIALFLLWSAASALFATNHWLAQRSLGVSVSGAVVFWGARSVAARGSYRPILVAAAIASVCAAALALAQAYGARVVHGDGAPPVRRFARLTRRGHTGGSARIVSFEGRVARRRGVGDHSLRADAGV